jgi:hypothetical protein
LSILEEATMKQAFLVGALAAAVALAGTASLTAQSDTTALGSVTLKRKVMADGKPLAAGTYVVRLTANEAQPAVGQSAGAERWVEFLQGGQVKGREVVSVISDADIGQIAKGPGKPTKGGYRVDLLKGNDYYRVWINKKGSNYLIHLPPA